MACSVTGTAAADSIKHASRQLVENVDVAEPERDDVTIHWRIVAHACTHTRANTSKVIRSSIASHSAIGTRWGCMLTLLMTPYGLINPNTQQIFPLALSLPVLSHATNRLGRGTRRHPRRG